MTGVPPPIQQGGTLGGMAQPDPQALRPSIGSQLPGLLSRPEPAALPQEPMLSPQQQAAMDFARELADHRQTAMQEFAGELRAYHMRAKGVLPNVWYGTLSIGKSALDGLAHLGSGMWKASGGIAGGMEEAFTGGGGGFWSGWESGVQQAQEDLRNVFGSADPTVVDAAATIGSVVGLNDPPIEAGRQADIFLREKLGDAALFTETVGFLASFATGPAAAIGRGSARAADKAMAPLARLMSRPAARALARKVGANPEAAKALLKDGRIYDMLLGTSEWKKSASLFARALNGTGQSIRNMTSLTAANVLQSGLMVPDEERLHQMGAAAMTSWAMVPIGRMASNASNWITQLGVRGEKAQQLSDAFLRYEAGKIGVREFQAAVRDSVGVTSRVAGTIVGSAFEGTLFTALNPEAHDLAREWMNGDWDAFAKLSTMAMANATGLAVVKGLVPTEMAPMFKRFRPDQNRLRLYIEAEANRRAAEQLSVEDVAPQQPAGPEAPPFTAPARPDPLEAIRQDVASGLKAEVDLKALREQEKMTPEDRAAAAQERMQRLLQDTAEGVRGDARENLLNTAARRAAEQMEQRVAQVHDETQARYGWADEPTAALLKSGWEPSFPREGDPEVVMTFGRDTVVSLTKGADGSPELSLSPRTMRVLEDLGVRLPEYQTITPDRVKVRGDQAQQLLRDVALASSYRQQQFAINAERLGMEEVSPGVWREPGDGRRLYVELDGTVSAKEGFTNEWIPGKPEVKQVVGDPGEPVWTHPNVEEMASLLRVKAALNPDRLPDAVLSQAIELARYGRGPAAEELRRHFEAMTPEQVVASVGRDFLKFAGEIGSLGAGFDNAQHMRSKAIAEAPVSEAPVSDALVADAPTARPDAPTSYAGANFGPEIRRLVEKSKPHAKRVADYFFEDLPETLSQAGLAKEARMVRDAATLSSRFEGEALARVRLPKEEGGKVVRPALEQMLLSREGKALAQENVRSEDGFEYSRIRMLADGKVEPRNQFERDVASAMGELNTFLRDSMARAGGFRSRVNPETGEGERVPIEQGKRSITQYVEGKGAQAVMDDPVLRQDFFNKLAQANQHIQVKDGKKRRPITGADIEGMWQKEQAKPAVQAESGHLQRAATEFQRMWRNYPDIYVDPTGKRHEMLEQNPFDTITAIADRQSRAIARQQVFGEDAGPARRSMLERGAKEGWSEAHMRALKGPGISGVMQEARTRLVQSMPKAERDRVIGVLDTALARVQGTEPIKQWVLTRALRDLNTMSASSLAAAAFVLDLPEPVFRTSTMMGAMRTARTILRMFRPTTFREAMTYLERHGAIQTQMGEFVMLESSKLARKASNIVGWLANKTERWKGAVNGMVVEDMIRAIEKGTATVADKNFVEFYLRLSPEEVAAVRRGGKLPEVLRDKILKMGTEFLTSRVRSGEGSRFGDDPNMRGLLLFTRFATQRAKSHLRVFGAMEMAKKKYGSGSPEHRSAMWQAVKHATIGVVGGGLAGKAVADALYSVMSLDEDQWKRTWNDLLLYPQQTLVDIVRNQTLGGPFSMVFRAIEEPQSGQTAWNSTSVGRYGYAMLGLATAAAKGDTEGVWQALAGSGLIPFRGQADALGSAIIARMVGDDPDYRLDVREVWDWRRKNDKMPPMGGDPKREEGFYRALRRLGKQLRIHGDPNKAIEAGAEDIAKALELAPGESVAASIRGMQVLEDLGNEDREALAQHMVDDESMSRLYSHDAALRELARVVSRMEGTEQTEFDAELERVFQQASRGASDRWNGLVERAVDQAALRLTTTREFGSEIRQVADRLAGFPEHLGSVFSNERMVMALQREQNTARRAKIIEGLLMRRAAERVRRDK